MNGRDKEITRISLSQLKDSNIDWSDYSFAKPEQVKVLQKKTPRTHQIPAIEAVVNRFEAADRGMLIMAPGTGKSYTSMAIAEKLAKKKNRKLQYQVSHLDKIQCSAKNKVRRSNYLLFNSVAKTRGILKRWAPRTSQ